MPSIAFRFPVGRCSVSIRLHLRQLCRSSSTHAISPFDIGPGIRKPSLALASTSFVAVLLGTWFFEMSSGVLCRLVGLRCRSEVSLRSGVVRADLDPNAPKEADARWLRPGSSEA